MEHRHCECLSKSLGWSPWQEQHEGAVGGIADELNCTEMSNKHAESGSAFLPSFSFLHFPLPFISLPFPSLSPILPRFFLPTFLLLLHLLLHLFPFFFLPPFLFFPCSYVVLFFPTSPSLLSFVLPNVLPQATYSAHTYTHTHAPMHIHTHTYTHPCTYTHTCTHAYAQTHAGSECG